MMDNGGYEPDAQKRMSEVYGALLNACRMLDSAGRTVAVDVILRQAGEMCRLGDLTTAEALYRLAIERVPLRTLHGSDTKSGCLAKAGCFLAEIGKFKELKEIEENIDERLASMGQTSPFLDSREHIAFVEKLALTGDEAAADKLYGSLLDSCPNKKVPFLPYTDYLKSYGKFLAERGRTEKTDAICGELARENDGRRVLDYVEHAGDLQFLMGQYARARELYNQAISDYTSNASQERDNIEQGRSLARLYLKVGRACLAHGDKPEAAEAADSAVQAREEHSKADRAGYRWLGNFGQPESDVLKIAGAISWLAGSDEKAKVYEQKAARMIQAASGDESEPGVRAGKEISDPQKPTDWKQLSKLSAVVFGGQEGSENLARSIETFERLRRVYKLRSEGKIEEVEEDLESILAPCGEGGSPLKRSLPGMGCLVSLALASKECNRADSLRVLKKLERLAAEAKSESPLWSAALFSNLAVVAQAEGDKKTAKYAWSKLEAALDKVQPQEAKAKSPGSHEGSANSLKLGEKLRYLSNSFRLIGQVDVALSLLDRADGAGVDLMMSLCDRGLTYLEMGSIEKGGECWRRLLEAGTGVSNEAAEKLMQIADILAAKGFDDEQRELLESLARTSKNDPVLVRLAANYNRSGRHPEGEAALRACETNGSSLSLEARSELGLALEKQGRANEAIKAYCEPAESVRHMHLFLRAPWEHERFLRRALEVAERSYGSDSPEIIPILKLLAKMFSQRNQAEEAVKTAQRAQDIENKTSNDTARDPDLQMELMNAQLRLDNVQDPMRIVNNLAGMAEADQDVRKVLLSLQSAVRALFARNQVEESINAYFQLLELQSRAGIRDPRQDPAIDGDSDQFIDIILRSCNPEQAERLLLRTLETRESLYGSKSWCVASCLSKLVKVYGQAGDESKFKSTLDRLIDCYIATDGRAAGRHVWNPVFHAVEQLAYDAQTAPDRMRARAALERILQVEEKIVGPNSQQIASTLNALAAIHLKAEDFQSAEPVLKRLLDVWEAVFGPERHFILSRKEQYAMVLRKLGKGEEAEKLFVRKGSPHKWGNQATFEVSRLVREAQSKLRSKDFDGALATLDEAKNIALTNCGRLSEDYRQVLKAMQDVYQAIKDVDKARECLLDRIDILKATVGHKAIETISATLEMAASFKEEGQAQASLVWVERTSKAAWDFETEDTRDIGALLRIAESFGELGRKETGLQVVEKCANLIKRQHMPQNTLDAGSLRQCSLVLKKLGFSSESQDLDRLSKEWEAER